jgi:hypothetical protein
VPFSDPDRLADLERAVLELRHEVDELRIALRSARADPAEAAGRLLAVAPPPPAPTPASTGYAPRAARFGRAALFGRIAAYTRTRFAGLSGRTSADSPGADALGPDLEAVVGRYGTVAVAALLILMAVGAFLTWAIATFTISPTARVGVGALGAAALAAVGVWLRRRGTAVAAGASRAPAAARETGPNTDVDTGEGTQRFGDVLLALSLAVTHVVAWAAGPFLGIVPPAAALAVAAAASAALAALARRGRQQALFLVGVGGALVAPFVTSGITGNALSLRVYGWLVLSSALLAVPTGPERARRWDAALRLLGIGGAVYTAAHLQDALGVAAIGDPAGLGLGRWTLRRDLPALFALACAAVPLARAAWWARTRAPTTRRPCPIQPFGRP